MTELEQRFGGLIESRYGQADHTMWVFREAYAALSCGDGSLVLAFELKLLAERHPEGSETGFLLQEVAEALRNAALTTPQGAGYLPKASK